MRFSFSPRDRRGGVLVFCALSLVVMMAMAGLVIDGGNLFLLRQRIQSAADSAALSAAGPFGGSSQAEQQRRAQFMFALNSPGGKNQLLTTCTVNGTRTTVELETRYSPSLLAALGVRDFRIAARAVAENQPATAGGGGGAQNHFDPFGLGGSAGSMFGKDSLTFSGNANVDSYNSDLGAYGGANRTFQGNVKTDGNYSSTGNSDIGGTVTAAGSFTLGGNAHVDNVFAGGSTSMNGNATVDGNLYTNGSASFNGNAGVDGSTFQNQSNSFPPTTLPPIDTTAVSVTNNNGSIPSAIKDNSTSPPSISLGGNSSGSLPAGTYYIKNLTISGNARLNIPSNVKLYVTGSLSVGGNGIANTSSNPDNVQLYYTSSTPLNFGGNTNFYGGIYAPNAPTTLSGNAEFYGAIVAKSLTMAGNGQVHVDKGLSGYVDVLLGSGNTGPSSGGGVTSPAHFGLIE